MNYITQPEASELARDLGVTMLPGMAPVFDTHKQVTELCNAAIKHYIETSVSKLTGTAYTVPALAQPAKPPPECQSEAEKTAYAFGWWKALESVNAQPAKPSNLLGEIIGCFDAAIAEGLYEAIAETTDERLKNLLERRLMHAYYAAIGPEVAQPAKSVELTAEELAAFLRFDETTGDDGSYDIEKPMMRRLAEIGLVFRKFGAYYQATEYGMSVLAANAKERT